MARLIANGLTGVAVTDIEGCGNKSEAIIKERPGGGARAVLFACGAREDRAALLRGRLFSKNAIEERNGLVPPLDVL